MLNSKEKVWAYQPLPDLKIFSQSRVELKIKLFKPASSRRHLGLTTSPLQYFYFGPGLAAAMNKIFMLKASSAPVVINILLGYDVQLHNYFFLHRLIKDDVAVEISNSFIPLSFGLLANQEINDSLF